MSLHKIIKCEKCGIVIAQCRCMKCDKTVQYSICSECSDTGEGRREHTTFRDTNKGLVAPKKGERIVYLSECGHKSTEGWCTRNICSTLSKEESITIENCVIEIWDEEKSKEMGFIVTKKQQEAPEKIETFVEFQRRLHCCQVSFDELAKWYYQLKYDVEIEEEENSEL